MNREERRQEIKYDPHAKMVKIKMDGDGRETTREEWGRMGGAQWAGQNGRGTVGGAEWAGQSERGRVGGAEWAGHCLLVRIHECDL